MTGPHLEIGVIQRFFHCDPFVRGEPAGSISGRHFVAWDTHVKHLRMRSSAFGLAFGQRSAMFLRRVNGSARYSHPVSAWLPKCPR